MLAGLVGPLAYIVALSTAIVLLPGLHFPVGKDVFGLTSFALSLLLVFRTNSSYERWDSARKVWGMVLNRSRDLVRQGLAYISPEQAPLRAMLCRWVPAFSKALMCHLRKGQDLRREVQVRKRWLLACF